MKITVKMVDQFFLISATAKVFLDGKECAWLGPGEQAELEAEPGQHEIKIKASIRKAVTLFNSNDDVMVTAKFNRVSGKLQMLTTGKDVEVLK